MQRTRVKICGITRPEQACAAAAAGANAIGLMLYPSSPRFVTLAQARAVCAALPPLISRVAVLVDPTPSAIERVVDELPVDVLQFHGDESPELCGAAKKPYVKAVRVRDRSDIAAAAARYPDARALLLDTYHDGLQGGTGRRFDWRVIPDNIGLPLILAGGLTPENVAEAVALVRPFAVDVSSGVERAPGDKDPDSMARFVREVLRGDANEHQR